MGEVGGDGYVLLLIVLEDDEEEELTLVKVGEDRGE